MKRAWFAVLLMFVCAVPAAAQDAAHEPDEEANSADDGRAKNRRVEMKKIN
ncbi:MAG TPA: hypothetical protein VGD94_16395 [Vicinamibacterales bacterium]